MKTKDNIFTLSIKIQITGCWCLHEQDIQGILTTAIHPYSKQIIENKKNYERYKK